MIRFLVLGFLSVTVSARTINTLCDFPHGGARIESFENLNNIRQSDYNLAMAAVERVYGPILKAKGCPLELIDGWDDGEVNAQAWKDGKNCAVEIFGGLARYPGMTKNAIIEAACHEIGHHLGGAPLYTGDTMSVEGQADRYATRTCMKNMGIASSSPSLALAQTLASLGGEAPVSRSVRATERVSKTIQEHPRAQCRLDTYDSAATGLSRRCCWYHGVCGSGNF